jgi:mannopine transport system permease protein
VSAADTSAVSARRLGLGPSLLLLAPLLAVVLVAFVLPLVVLLHESLFVPAPTLEHYRRLFGEPLYLRVIWRTFRIAAVVTLATLVLAYPLAWLMTRAKGWVLAVLVGCVLLPLWTSVLVRTYAWTVLLQRNGVLNQMLMEVGAIDAPVKMLYTEAAVVAAMTHVLLPFMVLPIWASLRAIPRDLIQAASLLGATPLQTFREVVWPLSLPGVSSGCLMVFLLGLGFFVTPMLIGGPQQLMVATLISQQVRELLNWPFAGALVGFLLLVTCALVLLFNRAVRLERFVGTR